jgi:hypothetical protein
MESGCGVRFVTRPRSPLMYDPAVLPARRSEHGPPSAPRPTERFDDGPEFVEFARSPEAQALFATTDASAVIARRLLAMTGLGILLVALSIGLWANVRSVAPGADINFINDARDDRWWATISASARIGLLVAAAICARLAKRWGIIGS